MPVRLTAELLEAFSGTFLSPMYDDPVQTPDCHREWWRLYCQPNPLAAIAAPRGHAKSTVLTHDFALANVCFQIEPHILIVSATEELALAHLGDIAKELRENEELRSHLRLDKFLVDSKSEIIMRCRPDASHPTGFSFRILARGSGQKLRGLKWNGRRPGLILCDDMEEDEQVENEDRRRKFRRWVMRALLPLVRREGRIRWHGTILHEDAMLARIMKDSTWLSGFYQAHRAFDDFSEILWPQLWSESRLRDLRQSYIEQNDPSGYSQEMLNDPFDNSEAYLRRADFLPMSAEDHLVSKRICIGCDFAVSKSAKANKTSFTVGGLDFANLIHILDERVGKWDTLEWIEKMFELQEIYDPVAFFVEDGVIWKSIAPTLYQEMQRRNRWLNCQALASTRDKATRGRPLQKHHRARAMRFAKEELWYVEYESELLRFTEYGDAVMDDRFDSTAILVRGFEGMTELDEDEFLEEEELELKYGQPAGQSGRSLVTGY